MARTNPSATASHAVVVAEAPRTYGGGFGSSGATPVAALRRLVGANLLKENQYYRAGGDTLSDLRKAADNVPGHVVAELAREAVRDWKLRHVPLALTALLAERERKTIIKSRMVRDLVKDVVTRADMLGELLAIYAELNGIKPHELKGKIPMAIKHGLADAFVKFDEYQLAKYDRAMAIRLRDVLFLTHPKPANEEMAAMWKRLVKGEMATPDTWEVGLSGGGDKKETFERLLNEHKLGDDAFLKNLRGMLDAKVDRGIIAEVLALKSFRYTLPFQFVAAAIAAPSLESEIDAAMQNRLSLVEKLRGNTLVLVDVSGSMSGRMSGKSKLDRLDAASGLAILLVGQSEHATVYATAGSDARSVHKTALIPGRRGMALRDSIRQARDSLGGGGIFFTQSLRYVEEHENGNQFERVVVITDEQDTDPSSDRSPERAPRIGKHNYVFNIGAYDLGLKTKAYWDVVTGFSESAIRYVAFMESSADLQSN